MHAGMHACRRDLWDVTPIGRAAAPQETDENIRRRPPTKWRRRVPDHFFSFRSLTLKDLICSYGRCTGKKSNLAAHTYVRTYVYTVNSSSKQFWNWICSPSFLLSVFSLFCFILMIHEGSHWEVYHKFQPPVMAMSTGGAKGCLDHRFRASPAYTAQLLTLPQHRANIQYKTANQIQLTLRVSSSTQATLEQSPIQVLTELNIAWLQW